MAYVTYWEHENRFKKAQSQNLTVSLTSIPPALLLVELGKMESSGSACHGCPDLGQLNNNDVYK